MTTAPIITPLKETTAVRANGHEAAAPKPEAPAPPFDVKTLSRASLAALLVAVQREIERLDEQDRNAALEATSKAFGISVARLRAALERETAAQPRPKAPANGDSTDGRKEVKPLYWNPSDHSQRWSGRGKDPEWVRTLLASGVTKEQMRIPEGGV
jgi:DNA-binding protein H-NS